MPSMKKILPLLGISVIFLAVSCKKNDVNEEKNVSFEEEEVENRQVVEEEIYYDVILENSTLCLYEVCGEKRIPVKSINIDVSYYPQEDILELKSGISAYSKEDGFRILENFVN